MPGRAMRARQRAVGSRRAKHGRAPVADFSLYLLYKPYLENAGVPETGCGWGTPRSGVLWNTISRLVALVLTVGEADKDSLEQMPEKIGVVRQ
jgi:hypothetical protein